MTTPSMTLAPKKRLTRWQRAWALARLGAYVGFACALAGGLAARSVYASALESSMGMGRELGKLGDLMGATKRLEINGQTLLVSTAGTDQSVHEVLDRFEASCADHATAMGQELERLPAAMRETVTHGSRAIGLGIVRKESGDDEGVIACFANDDPGGASAVVGRVKRLLQSGDLASLGRLRYVHAMKTKRPGGGSGTHVVAVWTDGSVKLGEMFPREGDAKGSDSSVAPRPSDAKRLLAAHVPGAPYAVRVYESSMPTEAYFTELDAKMAASGWTRVLAPNATTASHAFFDGSGVEMIATAESDGARTLVSIVELGHVDGQPESGIEK